MSIIVQCRYGDDGGWKDAFGIDSFFIKSKEVFMNPVDLLINTIIAGVFAYLKADGLSAEEAKTKMWEKVDQVEQLPQLPMDI